MPTWSMSGFVSSRFACRRASARAPRSVSPSYSAGRRSRPRCSAFSVARLVLGERLRRRQVERPRLRVLEQRRHHRQRVGERLAARGAGHDADVGARPGPAPRPRAGARRAPVMPAPTSADHRRGSRSNGSGAVTAGCGGTSSTCASRASLGGTPSASTSSHGRGTMPYGSGVGWRSDLGALHERDFRAALHRARSFSALGDALGPVAITFAVLDLGGAGDLGLVLGAQSLGLIAVRARGRGLGRPRVAPPAGARSPTPLRLVAQAIAGRPRGDRCRREIWQLAVARVRVRRRRGDLHARRPRR